MELCSLSSSLNSRTYCFYRRIQMEFLCTKTNLTRLSRNRSVANSLYSILSHLGDPNMSVVPVLDKWIGEGNSAKKWEVQRAITELTTTRRFRHALEVSLWMTNKRRFPVAPFDISVRLKLIMKNFGMEQAENYFNKIPENMKTYQIYLALLNCYVIAKSVDKAESIMQKARDLGYATKPVWYNLMMNLHCQLGNREKLGDLLIEMETKGVSYDQFTYSVSLRACAMVSDSEGMDKVVRMMESDLAGDVHWQTRVTAARGYLALGSIDEAVVMMNKLEKHMKGSPWENNVLFPILINLYAEAGKKDASYRIWQLCKEKGKVPNKVYISMMRALMKFNDIEGMEKMFEEWESSALSFDFRVPNFLIDAYCADGRLEKAEALINNVVMKGGSPIVTTWCHLARGYLKRNQASEAVKSLRKAISVCPPKFMSRKDSLITCLEYLEKGDCMEKAEELIMFIGKKGIWRDAAADEFRSLIWDSNLVEKIRTPKEYIDDEEESWDPE